MIKDRNNGVSLISLVITIIVLIILMSITFISSMSSIDKASFAKFVTGIEEVQESVRKSALTLDADLMATGKLITDGQKYNYIAKGGKSENDIADQNNIPIYSVIEEEAKLEKALPDLKTSTPSKKDVKVKFGVTLDGDVFAWPPIQRGNDYYITNTDKVDEETAGKTGSIDIVVASKALTINTNQYGELIDGLTVPVQDGKVALDKPKVKGSYVYNGKEQTVQLVNYNSNIMTITNNKGKDVGTRTAIISLKDKENYVWLDGTTDDVTFSWTITEKEVQVKWGPVTSFIYDGTEKCPTASVEAAEGETINLKISGGATDIGNYTATASIQSVANGNASNYKLTKTTRTFNITRNTVEATAVGYTGEYDEQEHTITVHVTKPTTGTTIYYSIGTILTESNYKTIGSTTNPGIKELGVWRVYYYVVASGRTAASGSETITIVKANINPVVSMADYVYGGTKSTPNITGVKENGRVTYYYNTSNTNTGGTNWNVVTNSTKLNARTYYLYATVDETTHYNSAVSPAVRFNVTKRTLTVTADDKTKTYGHADPSFTYQTSGNVTGQTPAFNGILTRNTGENVGAYLINRGSLSLKNNGAFLAGNYEISYNTGKLTIVPKNMAELTVTLSANTFTYNGTAQKPTPTVIYNQKTLIVGTDYDVVYTNNINAGTATITLTGKGNFTGTLSKTFTIQTAPMSGIVTISGKNANKETLTVNTSGIVPTGCTLSYQWYTNTSNSMLGGTAISGANSSTYTVTSDVLGKYIYVVVGAVKTNYSTAAFSAITNANNNNYATATCEHDYGKWSTTKAATCTATGTQVQTCSKCGDTSYRTISALGHSWPEWTTDKLGHNRKCTRTGCTATQSGKHEFPSYWSITTETHQHKCNTCGYLFTQKHSFENGTCTVCGTHDYGN